MTQTDEPTSGGEGEDTPAALLRAVLEIGRALRPLTVEARLRVVRRLRAKLALPSSGRERRKVNVVYAAGGRQSSRRRPIGRKHLT